MDITLSDDGCDHVYDKTYTVVTVYWNFNLLTVELIYLATSIKCASPINQLPAVKWLNTMSACTFVVCQVFEGYG